MIKKFRKKFILLSIVSVTMLLCIVVTGMNIINYQAVISEVDTVLDVLSSNQGEFPGEKPNDKPDRPMKGGPKPHIELSPEAPYESRYFSVLFDENGETTDIDISRVASVDIDSAKSYAKKALSNSKEEGFIDNFRYNKTKEDDGTRIIFLNCEKQLTSFRAFLSISILTSLIGILAVIGIIIFFSGKFIKPIAESHKKQKRFITDAGHELKTPITVINANIDLLEMELGQNESLGDIRLQTQKLVNLTNDLIALSRMDETENALQMIEFPISDVVYEIASPFCTLAHSQNKEFICNIQPLISFNGNDNSIRRLINILLDNALKYSPEGGVISLTLEKQGRFLYLSVFNTTKTQIDNNNLNRIFERFYRIDESRNSETGGHGIGLSIAKSIVSAHKGKITAYSNNDNTFEIKVILPL